MTVSMSGDGTFAARSVGAGVSSCVVALLATTPSQLHGNIIGPSGAQTFTLTRQGRPDHNRRTATAF